MRKSHLVSFFFHSRIENKSSVFLCWRFFSVLIRSLISTYGSFIDSQHTPVTDVVIYIIGHVKYDLTHIFEHTSLQWLRKEIPQHVLCRTVCDFYVAFFYLVCHKIVSYVYVPSSLWTWRSSVFGQQYSTHVVLVYCHGRYVYTLCW